MRKVGIMGGTFNPIHYGHLFLAENAYEQVGLDQVLFMPSKNPPHKVKAELAPGEYRAEMVRLAIQGNPHFSLSMMELEREGITYSVDTLSILTKEHPDTEYYFIVGADSFFMMQTWKNPEKLFQLCTIAVAGRDNVKEDKLAKQAKYLKDIFGARTISLQMPNLQISSAFTRDRIAANKSIRYYVPDDVITYITEKQLYRTVHMSEGH